MKGSLTVKGILSTDYINYAIELSELMRAYTAQVEEIQNKEMLKFIVTHATRKLKSWLKLFLLKDRFEIKEGLCA